MDTGIVRRIDDLGRIVIPAETRRLLNINVGDQLEIAVEDGRLIELHKLDASCTFCGATSQVRHFHDKNICDNCTAELANGN